MPFPTQVVEAAWNRSGGRCECKRPAHSHQHGRCGEKLRFEMRGGKKRGAWEAHKIDAFVGDVLSNCEIVCLDCFGRTS